MIPLSVPSIRGNEWKYVKECLDTEWVSSAGKYVEKFEEDICRLTGARHAVACVNGTAALQVALQVSGVKPGDEIIVPTVTFIAPVNVVRYLGAEPVFMDCDDYYNIDVEKVREFIETNTVFRNGQTINKITNRRISAIIPVHIFGHAVDMAPLVDICRQRNIRIVEDASESIGTIYSEGEFEGRHTGSIGDLGCYSFNGNKIVTAGGGGMIVTDNPQYARKARYLTTQAKDDPVRYIHHEIGYNFRLTNVQAALGVAQLEQLGKYIEIKKANYEKYTAALEHIEGLSLAAPPDYARVNYWFYCLQIEADIYGADREETMRFLAERGVQTRPIWHLNHLQRPYKNCFAFRIEKAHELLRKTLNLPCSVNLKDEDLQTVVTLLEKQHDAIRIH